MAKTAAERKQAERKRQQERDRALGVKVMTLRMATSERQAIAEGAKAGGFTDQVEYLLSLVYKDRDVSQKESRP